MQATEVTAQELARALFGLWRRIVAGREDGVFRLLDELELPLTQAKTLHVLHGCPEELSVKELADQLGLTLPSASRTIDALLRRGWAERREDEHDRRMKRVRISPSGRRVAQRLVDARMEGLAAFAAELSPDDRARLHEALSLLETDRRTP